MVFATNQGILKFNMDDIKKSVFIPKIRFACPDTLVVGPDGNSFAVEFAALDYGKNEDIIYRYKMEGLDDTWIYTKDNKIYFSALPPGKYRLVIRSTNSDGVWVDIPQGGFQRDSLGMDALRRTCAACIAGCLQDIQLYTLVQARDEKLQACG